MRDAQVLLDQHRVGCIREDGTSPARGDCVIPYSISCQRSGGPQLARISGDFLQEIVDWCGENRWPLLNSRAINEQEGQTGSHYDVAPESSILNWQAEVDACVRGQFVAVKRYTFARIRFFRPSSLTSLARA